MYLLSIIIPHYNSTVSLVKLLESIPDSEDIQTIVVDDYSDECDKEELIELNRDYNMMLLENNSGNSGAGACRNVGFKAARGDWILFADADDYFVEGFYDIIQGYFQSAVDVVFFKPTSIELDTGAVSSRHLPLVKLIDDVLYGYRLKEAELSLRYKFVVPWSKLYRSAFLKDNHIFFDEVMAANDVMFSTRVGFYIKKFKVSRDVIYCVTMNKGSLTMTINDKVFDTRLQVFINQYQFLRDHLSKTDFNKLGLSGRPLVIKAANMGPKKITAVFLKLRQHGIRVMEPKLFNPIWFIQKGLFVRRRQKREQKYLNKG